jgi:hypothetical protein
MNRDRTTIAVSKEVTARIDASRSRIEHGSRSKFSEFLLRGALNIIDKHGLSNFISCGENEEIKQDAVV